MSEGMFEILTAESQHVGYGQQRKSLEDRCLTTQLRTAGGLLLSLGMVADSIGGVGSGELVAQVALDAVVFSLKQANDLDINSLLQKAIQDADEAVKSAVTDQDVQNDLIGTALTIAAIYEQKLYVAHIGASRLYLVRHRKIHQLTMDHTWGNEMLAKSQFIPEEIVEHPRRDELVRYIGMSQSLEPDIGYHLDDLDPVSSVVVESGYLLKPGDVIVLCTDGLIGERRGVDDHYVNPEEIASVVSRSSPQNAANTLVSLALGRQVDDNVSVIIMKMPGRQKEGRVFSAGPMAFVIGSGILGGLITIGLLVPYLFSGVSWNKNISLSPAVSAHSSTETDQMEWQIGVISRQGEGLYQLPDESANPLVSGHLKIKPGTVFRIASGLVILESESEDRFFLPQGTNIVVGVMAMPDLGYEENTFTLMGEGNVFSQIEDGSIAMKLPHGVVFEASEAIVGMEYAANGVVIIDCFEGECRLLDEKMEVIGDTSIGRHYLFQDGSLLRLSEAQVTDRIAHWSKLLKDDSDILADFD